jgi:hypothetical protein
MSDPVEFIQKKLAMVDKVLKEDGWKADKDRVHQNPDDEPIYCVDDDYHHPLVGDALVVIDLAKATRALMELHKQMALADQEPLLYPPRPTCNVCADWEARDYDGAPPLTWPCPTILALAQGWGWTG